MGKARVPARQAPSPKGKTWVGDHIRGIDYERFARYHRPEDVYFELNAEQIGAQHRQLATSSRVYIAWNDGETDEPLIWYVSDDTPIEWLHACRSAYAFK